MQEHMDEIEAEFSSLHNQDNRDELEGKNKSRHIISIFLYLCFMIVPALIFTAIAPLLKNSDFVFKDYSASQIGAELAATEIDSLYFVNENYYQTFKKEYESFLVKVYQDGDYAIYTNSYASIYTVEDFSYENNKLIGIKQETLDAILSGERTKWGNNKDILIVVPKDDAAPIYTNSAIFNPLTLIDGQRMATSDFSNLFSFVLYIGFTLIMYFVMKPSLKLDLPGFKSEKPIIANRILSGIVTIFAINIVTNIITTIISTIAAVPNDISQNQLSINRSLNSPWMILMVLTAVCLAPIIEELVFRKAFFGLIKNPKIALVVSSIVFGLIHMTTEIGEGNFLVVFITGLGYIAGGISLGLVYMSNKKNIYYPIVVHAAYNLIGMLLQIFMR